MSVLTDAQTANPDRYTGYTVTAQQENNPNAQTTYAVTRDANGTGLGAYATIEQVEHIIQADRQMIASLPPGIGYIPPLVNITVPPETANPAQ
jgi:hypothetical protein